MPSMHCTRLGQILERGPPWTALCCCYCDCYCDCYGVVIAMVFRRIVYIVLLLCSVAVVMCCLQLHMLHMLYTPCTQMYTPHVQSSCVGIPPAGTSTSRRRVLFSTGGRVDSGGSPALYCIVSLRVSVIQAFGTNCAWWGVVCAVGGWVCTLAWWVQNDRHT